MNAWILNEFLYFPEDKSEYIPAVIELAIILVLCVLVFNFFRRKARRDAEKTKELEEKIARDKNSSKQH
ncbi:hypothetical protein M2M59_11525 [Rummeliibacillus sp. G93]|uniref:Uncharacterized protein n=1 Tax=Rummeliibacillus stabekisii TaxID=241244 RepID=A0A143HDY7_9BACL|nr:MULTISPECIES: hypothetical protein [Rummeliibacillus]AMW99700.1 hypothetical protein ATY39_09765 [Rummeliibacillus stabekisii]MBB5170917.1 preprotein translocase subunit YajC [Rummeliibacillus stabekisii]MCM3317095.1 hypothetical protein [Rummeliibacillus stabekisii]UQW96593.1 hypothetical protein M2M59_11525 [Rummeliibacillus sp. G93]GEL05429.1 hypothetical protein RST01_20560 [Rummeliibacillus stabekisii]